MLSSNNPGDFNNDFLVNNEDLAAIAAEYSIPEVAVDAILEWHNNYGSQYYDTARDPIILPSGDVIPAIGDGGDIGIGPISGTFDALIIPEGTTAAISGFTSVKELRVEGTLILDSAQSVELEAETILVTVTGNLISQPQETVNHKITLGGQVPTDSGQITQGMIVIGGIDFQGAEVIGPQGTDPTQWSTSRSVEITSKDPSIPAHIMVAGPATYHVTNTLINNVGRTTSEPLGTENHIGRYAFHLHHNKGGGVFHNNVVLNPQKWGVAIHFTKDAVITGNTILGATGAGISFEAGLEHDNIVLGNYIGLIQGNGESPYSRPASEGGFAGDGIWLRGAGDNNIVENNIISQISGSGIAFFARFENEADIQPKQMGSLRGNLVVDADVGYSFYGVGEDYKINDGEYFNARGLRAENVRIGIETSYTGLLDFSESTFTGNGTGTGIKAGSSEWLLLEDMNISGFGTGLQANAGFTVRDGHWNNNTNIQYSGVVVGLVEGADPQWLRHKDIEICQPTWGPNSTKNIDLPEIESPQRFRNYTWQQNVVYTDEYGDKYLIYREGQQASVVPPDYEDSRTVVEPGQTNQDLYDNYRLAFLGRIMPTNVLNNEEFGYHALAPADITPAYCFNTTTERLADGRLAIRWKTDEPATSQVEWAVNELKTTEWANLTPLDATLKTDHEVIIDAPVGTIAFMRYSADAEGNMQQMYRHGGFTRRTFTHRD